MFDILDYKRSLQKSTSIDDCTKVPLPRIDENQNYIFISYSHLDYKNVYADLADMYAAGVRFWYDKGLSAGRNWDDEVKSKIESPNCVGVIFYMSENLFKSESANKEIRIAYDASSNENKCNKKNYFGVNLTGKSSAEILMTAITSSNGSLTMEHINTLSAAFSDKATYIDYNSQEHMTDLISQIKLQFEVIDESGNDELIFKVNNQECDVFITFLGDNIKEDEMELAKEIVSFLSENGISSYIADASVTQSQAYNEFINKQNVCKLQQCKNILFVAYPLLANVYYKQIEEFFEKNLIDKNVIYFIEKDTYHIGVHEDLENKSVCLENYKDILLGLIEN